MSARQNILNKLRNSLTGTTPVPDNFDEVLVTEPWTYTPEQRIPQLRKLMEAVHFLGEMMGWEVTYSDKRDLFMKFYFNQGYFFIRATFANGLIIQVKKQEEGITDELVLNMLYQLRVAQSILSEYQYYGFFEMIQNVWRGRGSDV